MVCHANGNNVELTFIEGSFCRFISMIYNETHIYFREVVIINIQPYYNRLCIKVEITAYKPGI